MSIRKILSELVTNPTTGRVSHTKLAASSAYFVGTLCFIWYHCFLFNPNTPVEKFTASVNIMPELWLFYFGVIAGHAGANKFMAQKRDIKQVKKDDVD